MRANDVKECLYIISDVFELRKGIIRWGKYSVRFGDEERRGQVQTLSESQKSSELARGIRNKEEPRKDSDIRRNEQSINKVDNLSPRQDNNETRIVSYRDSKANDLIAFHRLT